MGPPGGKTLIRLAISVSGQKKIGIIVNQYYDFSFVYLF
jgi:hypothetical protein